MAMIQQHHQKRHREGQGSEKGIEVPRPTAHQYYMCVLARHCGVLVRRTALVLGMLAAVAAAATTGAFALDEQRMAIPNGAPDAPKAQVQDQSTPKSEEGAEIRIPGLGKLGTLPKMDFGLELLYGAAEDNRSDQNSEPAAGPEAPQDLTIHGSMKHRF